MKPLSITFKKRAALLFKFIGATKAVVYLLDTAHQYLGPHLHHLVAVLHR